ncbi:MAG: sigma-70 family RNA polymerase sigma factor [Candidatus Cloacimonetes bacterium]|nr:sigma-70 family RNA polymerase sigma factor [Candidatus Cloacimonadota bacterium]
MKEEEIIKEYLPLVKSIANKYKDYGIPLDDLIQDGIIGLWQSIKKFDPKKDTKFSTYATYWIKKRILEALERERKTSLNALPLNENIKISKVENKTTTKNIEYNQKTFVIPEDFPELERKVLTLLYGLADNNSYDLTQISKMLNFPRERVRQIKEKGLRRLRRIQQHKYKSE